jgi:MFS family permease
MSLPEPPAPAQTGRPYMRQLLAVCFVVFAGYLGLGMIIPVRVLYAEEQGASYAVIGAMATAFLITNFIFQFPVGWIADHWGRKRIMSIGLVAMAVLTFLYLFVTDPVWFVVLRLIEGVASATLLPPARALIADRVPPERRGEAFGIFGSFFNAGFVVGPGIGSLLASLDYNLAFVGAVVARLAAALVVLLLIRETLGDRRKEEEAGHEERFSPRVLFTLPLVAVYILVFSDFLYVGFDQTVFPLWMRDYLGAGVGEIGLVYVAFGIPPIILSPIAGRLADRVRRSHMVLWFGLAQVPLYFVYAYLDSPWPLVGLSVLHGALFAFTQPAVDAHLASWSGSRVRARIQGVYSSAGLIGAFVGANALTAVYALDFRLPLFILGTVFCVGLLVGGVMMRVSERG